MMRKLFLAIAAVLFVVALATLERQYFTHMSTIVPNNVIAALAGGLAIAGGLALMAAALDRPPYKGPDQH